MARSIEDREGTIPADVLDLEMWISSRKNSALLAREWIHGPANAHANQQKKKQRPDDVFDTFVRSAAAQESERDGDEQREKRHRLKMAEMEIRRPDHAFRPRAAS